MHTIQILLSLFHLFIAPPLPNESECAFCNETILESQKFYEDDLVIALWNYKQAVPGHSLIIPKRHVERFESLTDEESLRLAQVIKKVHSASKEVFKAESYLLYQKNGHEVGQTVPHVHFHYLPRELNDDSLLSLAFNICTFSLKKPLSTAEMADLSTRMQLALNSE